MICARCSTPIPDNSQFCLSCGADLSDPSASTSAALTDAGVSNMERMLREATRGEFEIERELGRGGMAVVYLATEVHLKRKVAIKVLPPELTFGAGTIERFQREAQTAAALDHPNIIPIHRIGTSGDLFWYAMKYVEGRSLEDILKREGKLDLSASLDVLEQIAAALEWAHQRQVVHRDVKPANMMVDPVGRVIVTDFGIAKALSAATLTASGSTIGTPYYMSPEQCMGTEITGAADQYSLAVMTYQMLSGQLPFESDSAVELIQKHCFVPPPSLEAVCPGLPQGVYKAIERAMAKKAPERFDTVSEFVRALKHAHETGRTTAEAAASPGWESDTTQLLRPTRRKRRVGVVLAAVAALAASAGGIFWWTALRPDESRSRVEQQTAAGPAPQSTTGVDEAMEQTDSSAAVPASPPLEATTDRPAPARQQRLPVAVVAVRPSSRRLTVGQSVQLTASASATNGNALTDRTFTWVSSDNGVATVSGSGTVTAAALGDATITATAEGVTGTATIAVAPQAGQERQFELAGGVNIAMAWIPPGRFTMGSPASETDRRDNEGSAHSVSFRSGFWMSKYEVTQGQWQAVMGANPASSRGVGDNNPVHSVSWNDIQGFLDRANDGFRLPSEAEWEYAARAGGQTRFYWGDDPGYGQIGRYAVYNANDPDGAAQVGTKQPNAWGLYGHVRERVGMG